MRLYSLWLPAPCAHHQSIRSPLYPHGLFRIYTLSPPHASAKSTLSKVLNLVLVTDDLIQLLCETAAPALPHTRVYSLPNNVLILFLGRETVCFSS